MYLYVFFTTSYYKKSYKLNTTVVYRKITKPFIILKKGT